MKKLLLTSLALAALLTTQAKGREYFESNMNSLEGYECPEWYQDAKFGIWSHWGPHAETRRGDWYARVMYEQHNTMDYKKDVYEYHLEKYGHPSEFGFKDIIPLWKAEKFDPESLMKLYKAAGAKYFVSMGVFHDNFDMWDSKFSRWNAVEMGPKRDIVGEWSAAAKKCGLKFGVSEHLSAGYDWWQSNKGADSEGEYAGVPYDGVDPHNWDLYYDATTQKRNWTTNNAMFAQLWYAKMNDLITSYQPDLLYTDGALPFGTYGERMLADLYNTSIDKNRGSNEAVYLAKSKRAGKGWAIFNDEAFVEDIERGGLKDIRQKPWQTDTSIGDWFYNEVYKCNDTGTMYRSPFWVISTLVDVVSKNGNMLLNIIQRPDGSLDEQVLDLLADITVWMECNGESIFATRPWICYGEGPQQRGEMTAWHEDFDYTPQDIRYTRDKADKILYATAMGMPTGDIVMSEVARSGREVKRVELLGSKEKLSWSQSTEALTIALPDLSGATIVPVFKITWR